MGLRFRKSFKSGPFRVNLSKSGVSYSIGTKGARITKKATGGARATIGTSGVYYAKDFGGSTVSRKNKTKKKIGCLTWIGGIVAVLAVIGLLGSCYPEDPETNIPEETPAIVEEKEQTPEVTEEQEQPKEKEVIEFEPVFVDPYSGERTDEETTELPSEEQSIEQEPVVVPDAPVVETTGPVAESGPITPPVAESDPAPQGQIVYITNSGKKYHRAGCRHLKESCTEVTLEYAQNNQMEACKNCH